MQHDSEEREPIFRLDRSTLVPIGLLIAVVLASITATTWIQKTLIGLEHKIDNLHARVDAIAANNNGHWTIADMQSWADLLSARNANLVVPVPKRN